MNYQEADILKILYTRQFESQRALAEATGHSLGVVNRSIRHLIEEGLLSPGTAGASLTGVKDSLKHDGGLNSGIILTRKARDEIRGKAPRNAIILAAGFGMRMVPINLTTPKALLEVHGERLIDRQIRQLHAVGIHDITVVVGFMKDSFEYLIDEFGVSLVVNEEYASRNNLHSLALVADRINNTYIVPCDIWCADNPFSRTELYSWYMVAGNSISEDASTSGGSSVRVNRKRELVAVTGNEPGNTMIGISYLLEDEARMVRKMLKQLDNDRNAQAFWEEALFWEEAPSGEDIMRRDRMSVLAKVMSDRAFFEINTYEQLRDLDSGSGQLRSGAISTIADALGCREADISDISVLKKGMTNRSFLFSAKGEKYIMRIPGEGTERLINRSQEAEVFRTISGLGLCDDPVYIDPENGYKITRYLEGARTCDPHDEADLERCMNMLKRLHGLRLKVGHTFDFFGQIEFYESLWDGAPSVYRDYCQTKANVLSLLSYIEAQPKDWCLTHIDAVPDNFLFYREGLQLTDWEYSGMQDPHVDIAMFCIYSMYDRAECDRLIDIYFEGKCDNATRTKIYCYIAVCGLLWSNWCEYKRKLGVEFGEYSLRQYRYAKEFYRLVIDR